MAPPEPPPRNGLPPEPPPRGVGHGAERRKEELRKSVKFALDALQPRVVFDDKIVTKVVAEKKWCDGASAECTTIELLVRCE